MTTPDTLLGSKCVLIWICRIYKISLAIMVLEFCVFQDIKMATYTHGQHSPFLGDANLRTSMVIEMIEKKIEYLRTEK